MSRTLIAHDKGEDAKSTDTFDTFLDDLRTEAGFMSAFVKGADDPYCASCFEQIFVDAEDNDPLCPCDLPGWEPKHGR